jgi:hypothetical protein
MIAKIVNLLVLRQECDVAVFHLTSPELLPSILERGLEPGIGPRSTELGETVAGVYCFPDRSALEAALGSWLETVFDPEDPLACLVIDERGLSMNSDADYEIRVVETIDPERIRVLTADIWNEDGIPSLQNAVCLGTYMGRDDPAP